MLNSEFRPTKTIDFTPVDLNIDFKGYTFATPNGAITDCDIPLTDDCILEGGRMLATQITQGDKVTCQVIDKDNVLGMGANYVVKQFVTDWYMAPGTTIQWDFSVTYPVKLKGGLYVRVIYTSISEVLGQAGWFALNLKLHKVMW